MMKKFTTILVILCVFIVYSLVMYEGGRLAGFTEAVAICEVLSE